MSISYRARGAAHGHLGREQRARPFFRVIDSLIARLPQIDEIQIAIAPGQRAPRGEATIAAVLGYAGRPFKWRSRGAWRDAWGWQELKRMRFLRTGRAWAAACDVPDLELFPKRYPGVRTMEFRASLELGTQQLALGSRRCCAGAACACRSSAGEAARPDGRVDGRLGRPSRGMAGERHGEAAERKTARGSNGISPPTRQHGPEIPCMAAILLARKLARGGVAQPGAFPCMGFPRAAGIRVGVRALAHHHGGEGERRG